MTQTAVSKPTERLEAKKLLVHEKFTAKDARGRLCKYKSWKLSDSKDAFLWLWLYCINERENRRFMLSPYFARNHKHSAELLFAFARETGLVQKTLFTQLYEERGAKPYELPGYREQEECDIAEQHYSLVFALPGLFYDYHVNKKRYSEDLNYLKALIPENDYAFRFLRLIGSFEQALHTRNEHTRRGFKLDWTFFTLRLQQEGRSDLFKMLDEGGHLDGWRRKELAKKGIKIKKKTKEKKNKKEAQGRKKRR